LSKNGSKLKRGTGGDQAGGRTDARSAMIDLWEMTNSELSVVNGAKCTVCGEQPAMNPSDCRSKECLSAKVLEQRAGVLKQETGTAS